ncbi:MAG: hypothetical protein R3247_15690 [Rhodothermales bacterium]|nr:hypothetical protein [Rhodothermales bacterium]
MKSLLMAATASAILIGCQGVRFADAPVNEHLPTAFTERAVYPGGVAGYEFQDLVGRIILIEEGHNPLPVGLVRHTGFSPRVIPITEPNNYYRSRIQRGAEAQGAYLAFVARFQADEMAELTLVDVARAGITLDSTHIWDELLAALTRWVRTHPKDSSAQTRLWVQSVVLTRRIFNTHSKISANASGQIGHVTGVETGVYRRSEEDIQSVLIGLEAFDVDRMVEQAQPAQLPETALGDVRFVGMIEGVIEAPSEGT